MQILIVCGILAMDIVDIFTYSLVSGIVCLRMLIVSQK